MKNLFEVGSTMWYFKYRLISIFISPVTNFFTWIKKSCQYAWFLRNDYDWDYVYLLKLIHFKMDRMQRHIKRHKNHTDSDQCSKEIRNCMKILNRLIEDDYMSPEMKIHIDEFSLFDKKSENKKDSNMFRQEMDKEQQLRIREEKLFFSTFQKNFRKWWD